MLTRLIAQMENRWPTASERTELTTYLATSRSRRAALEEVRSVVDAVGNDVVSQIREMYPQFGRFHGNGYEKGKRDIVLLTNMTANAMFLGEWETTDHMFTFWYRTILKAVHLTPQFMSDTFLAWQKSLQKRLSPEAFTLMKPFVHHFSEVLSDIAVPVRPEVGDRNADVARRN